MEQAVLDAITQATMSALDPVESSLKEALAKQAEEIKNHGGTLSATSKTIQDLEKKYQERLDDLTGKFEDLQKKHGRLPGLSTGQDNSRSILQTPGNVWTDSEAYKEWKSKGFTGDSRSAIFASTFKGHAPLWEDAVAQAAMERKDITGGDDLRNVLSIERILEIMRNPVRQQRVRDLLPVYPTTNSSIEYTREKSFTNRAAPVQEGNVKPQSAIEFEDRSMTVRTIAHWLPVNRQLLADIRGLQAYLNTRLIEGLKLKEDQQLLYGNGSDPNLQGILTDPDIQVINQGAGETAIDAVRRGLNLVRLSEFSADGIVLHPSDWMRIELAKDNENRYLWTTVTMGGEQRLWRVPVIDTTAIQEGQVLTGSFRMGAAIWDREQANIRASEHHSDYFVRNKMAILVEERIAQTIFRAICFVLINLTLGS